MIFRIDDIGASTKKYNQHSKSFPFCSVFNVWFLKRMWPFKGWGPYNELTLQEWQDFLLVCAKNNIKPIVAITACWVEKNGKPISFPEKFPEQAQFLKQALQQGKIVIANHGLTHCVVGKHLPKFFGSNRKFHREFWPWLADDIHEKHILKSQEILEKFFEKPIEIFVPPGNIWSVKTYEALKKTNIKKVIANRYMADSEEDMQGIEFCDDREGFFVFHDKDLKLKGTQWINNMM